MKPLVLITEPIHEDGTALLSASAEVVVLDAPSDARLATLLPRATGVIVRSAPFRADLIDRAPQLRVIGRHGAGLDNIDVEFARSRGIAVVNTPRSNTLSVAEHVIAVMLSLAKRIDETSSALSSGRFLHGAGSLPAQVSRSGLIGQEIVGARLGIVGLGAIGREVARRGVALGMTVTAFDPYLDVQQFHDVGADRAVALEALLPVSDYLTVHVPGTGQPLITAAELALLPAGAFLINTARGTVVDASDLVAAVRSGHLGGAAVDVYDPEPPDPRDLLLNTPGIICTPHTAAMTAQALRRMAIDVSIAVRDELHRIAAPAINVPRGEPPRVMP